MADKSPSINPEHRVILWGMARSLSTVFEKCMSFVEGVQIISEPYQCAATLGPEGVMGNQKQAADLDLVELSEKIKKVESDDEGWDDSICTYQWVKNALERDYSGKKLVFCKDLITGITGKYDMLARGYQHTFIIRNPVKVFVSLRKGVVGQFLPPGTSPQQLDISTLPVMRMQPPGLGFGEMVDFIEHLKKIDAFKSEPIVIDADDLQNHPESIVRQYCEKTGIPFSKSLLTWEAGDGIVKKNWIISKGFLQGNRVMNYFAAAFASTGFQPAKDPPSALTPDVIKLAEQVEPHYRKLYEMRIRP